MQCEWTQGEDTRKVLVPEASRVGAQSLGTNLSPRVPGEEGNLVLFPPLDSLRRR